MTGLEVRVLRNADGTYRARFHRHDAYDCAGRRMHEEKHPDLDDYVLVDIWALSPGQKACQFACCFCGLPDAEAVIAHHGTRGSMRARARAAALPPPTTGLRVGQSVTVRDLASGETKHWKIVATIGEEKPAGALAAQSPIAHALLGHHAGDTVTVGLPRGARQLVIEQIEDASS